MPALYQNVWSQGAYIYHTTDSGIDVYNDDASSILNHIALPIAASAVWADDNYVYMGTTGSGVYRSTASGIATEFLKYPDITSNDIIYLHGDGMYLCLTTESGVDRWDFALASGISTTGQSLGKCRQIANGNFYYARNNLFYNINEVDLGDELRYWNRFQHLELPIPAPSADVYLAIVFAFDFPYISAQNNGDDLRFLDVTGNNLQYYVRTWGPPAEVVVKLPTADMNEIYMLYGNPRASAQSTFMSVVEYDEITTAVDGFLWDLIQPKLYVMYAPSSNWLEADYTYDTFYTDPLYINDIHTTSGTSTTGGNTIFLATDRGAHVIDERQGDEENANVKRYYIK